MNTFAGPVLGFAGPFRFLSNFVPCPVWLDGWKYSSVEHAYQAAKTTDNNQREAIRAAATPGEAKRLGRTVTIRPDWLDVRVYVMRDLLKQKFTQVDYRDRLLGTDNWELVETNWWNDTFWGVCRGIGKNQLGLLLMAVRDQLNDKES